MATEVEVIRYIVAENRTTGVIEVQVPGPQGVGVELEQTFPLVNNQEEAADIDGLLMGAYKSAMLHYYVERVTTGAGATDLRETSFAIITKTGANSFRLAVFAGDLDAGITLSMSLLVPGQVQYVSSNITGTPSESKIAWRLTRLVG